MIRMSLKEMSDEIEMLRNKMLKYENEDLKKEIEHIKRHQSDYEISVANNLGICKHSTDVGRRRPRRSRPSISRHAPARESERELGTAPPPLPAYADRSGEAGKRVSVHQRLAGAGRGGEQEQASPARGAKVAGQLCKHRSPLSPAVLIPNSCTHG